MLQNPELSNSSSTEPMGVLHFTCTYFPPNIQPLVTSRYSQVDKKQEVSHVTDIVIRKRS